jgi:peptidoglycan-associated lipoprotein
VAQINREFTLGSQLFRAEFTVEGDRLVGHVPDSVPDVQIVLVRVPSPPQAAVTPPPAPEPVAPPPAPAPPPPVAETPPPAPAPPPVAAAPSQPPAPPEPQRTAPPPSEFAAAPELRPVFFAFDRSDIAPAQAATLRADAEWLKAHPGLVLIEGHCDERGTNEYNLALGERRARSTMAFLIAQGVPAADISIVTYGEERPVCTDHTEACWKQNRRAVLLVRPR